MLLFAEEDCACCDNAILKLDAHDVGSVVQAAKVDDFAVVDRHHLLTHDIEQGDILDILIGVDVDECCCWVGMPLTTLSIDTLALIVTYALPSQPVELFLALRLTSWLPLRFVSVMSFSWLPVLHV